MPGAPPLSPRQRTWSTRARPPGAGKVREGFRMMGIKQRSRSAALPAMLHYRAARRRAARPPSSPVRGALLRRGKMNSSSLRRNAGKECSERNASSLPFPSKNCTFPLGGGLTTRSGDHIFDAGGVSESTTPNGHRQRRLSYQARSRGRKRGPLCSLSKF